MTDEITPKEFVNSLARGLAVIKAFDRDNKQMTLTQVANRTDLTRATARRFLFTLVSLGYVQSDGKQFWLMPKVLELGYSYLASLPIVEIVQPYIERISQETHEACSVSVLDGEDIVYIARHVTQRIMSVVLHLGIRLPAHVTSMGRVLLANLPDNELEAFLAKNELKRYTDRTITDKDEFRDELRRVREKGYALVNQELEIGLQSIAVPIKSKGDRVIAAMNIGTNYVRIKRKTLTTKYLRHLQLAADEIQKSLLV